jgi:hypothetical protein
MPHRPNRRRNDRPDDFDGVEAARLLYGGASTPDADDDSDDDGEDDSRQAKLFE